MAHILHEIFFEVLDNLRQHIGKNSIKVELLNLPIFTISRGKRAMGLPPILYHCVHFCPSILGSRNRKCFEKRGTKRDVRQTFINIMHSVLQSQTLMRGNVFHVGTSLFVRRAHKAGGEHNFKITFDTKGLPRGSTFCWVFIRPHAIFGQWQSS